jgi:uncharacterized protein (DUF2062 family)
MKYFSKFKEDIIRFNRQGVSGGEIAFGIALGTFIGFIPMIGVHTVLAIGLAYILRLNPLMLLLGTQISNPFSFPFLLYISVEAGNVILHRKLLGISFSREINYVDYYIIPLIIGSIVIGTIVSGVSYLLVKKFLKR